MTQPATSNQATDLMGQLTKQRKHVLGILEICPGGDAPPRTADRLDLRRAGPAPDKGGTRFIAAGVLADGGSHVVEDATARGAGRPVFPEQFIQFVFTEIVVGQFKKRFFDFRDLAK